MFCPPGEVLNLQQDKETSFISGRRSQQRTLRWFKSAALAAAVSAGLAWSALDSASAAGIRMKGFPGGGGGGSEELSEVCCLRCSAHRHMLFVGTALLRQ